MDDVLKELRETQARMRDLRATMPTTDYEAREAAILAMDGSETERLERQLALVKERTMDGIADLAMDAVSNTLVLAESVYGLSQRVTELEGRSGA